MQIGRTHRALLNRLQQPTADNELARASLREPELTCFESCSALLELLAGRDAEQRPYRNRLVGALLRLSQRHRSQLALELLYVAYFPTLAELAGDLFRYRRIRDIDECQVMAVEAFFEATQRVRLDGEQGTAHSLLLKTRQRAFRETIALDRRASREDLSPEDVSRARSRSFAPEAELLQRERDALAFDVEQRLGPLLDTPCDEGVSLRETLTADDRSLFRHLRRLHPEENIVTAMRRYQRVRARRSRHLRTARKNSHESLSQLQGYLEILDQEDP